MTESHKRLLSLLSFIPPSYIVAHERLLANILVSFSLNTSTNLQELSVEMTNNIEDDTPRGQSISPSSNSFRLASVHSNTSSKVYVEYIQALNNSPAWSD